MIEKTQGHLNTTKTGSVHALHADVVEVENEEDPETEKGRRNPEVAPEKEAAARR